MRIQRYIAKDMRTALAQVREALGPDAVILSSGRVGDDVEVVAAIDMEVARAVENAPPARIRVATRAETERCRRATQAAAPPMPARSLQNRASGAAEAAAPLAALRRHRAGPSCAGRAGAAALAGQRSAGERNERHAPHARVAARDAGVERHVAPLADPGGHAQGAGAARHHAGSGQLAGPQDSRGAELLGRAPLRARDRRAHHPGHRRSLAGAGRRRRLRGSRRRRQDHAAGQAGRALGAAPWPAPRRARVGGCRAHRRA